MTRWYVERSRAYPAAYGYTGPLSERQARREQQGPTPCRAATEKGGIR